MQQQKLGVGPLLGKDGTLNETGYATSLVKNYDRGAIKASRLRIKEWDYFLLYNGDYGVALTLADNGYMGLVSASFLDFSLGAQHTESKMFFFPMGKLKLPAASGKGRSAYGAKGYEAEFTYDENTVSLYLRIDNAGGYPLLIDAVLSDAPRDSMVIATPFDNPKAFYYNQKIIGYRAKADITFGGKKYFLRQEDSYGMLDWGRGVWTYDNTWYWGAGQGEVDGHTFGFNIGYGFGRNKNATENMLFYDGIAHKLEHVAFNIPQKNGRDDYMSPWAFTSSDNRFEMLFSPILDRAALTSLGIILSDQHQVFGYFDGTAVLDDGSSITLNRFLGFAEKVRNKW